MYCTDVSMKKNGNPGIAILPVRKGKLKSATCHKIKKIAGTLLAPVLLPKEEQCCNTATD